MLAISFFYQPFPVIYFNDSRSSPLSQSNEQHHGFSEKDLLNLHRKCNTFMQQWVDLYGATHITNYIHIIGSGHLPYFAKKYGNLYRFSQQGWEALNQMIKHYYFNNTNHGGSLGIEGKDADGKFGNKVVSGDHCLALIRLCQRALMWKLGLGDAYFINKELEKEKSINEDVPMVDQDLAENPDLLHDIYETPDGHMFGYL
jgi:hypothetical protein